MAHIKKLFLKNNQTKSGLPIIIPKLLLYVPNIRVSKFIKQSFTDLKEQIDITIIGMFNNPLIIMAKLSKQKINKETADLNYDTDQTSLKDIQTILPNRSRTYILLKCIQNILHDRSQNKS